MTITLNDQIEDVEANLAALISKAETGEQWAEIALIEARDLKPLIVQANPFEAANVTFANNPPVDPLRRAAESLDFAAKLTPGQLNWARSHDWFDSIVDGALIVTDSFTYQGRSYEDRIIWGGTFTELRNWAGY